VKKALSDKEDVPTEIFDHFKPSTAKWRYETIAICMHLLLKFRRIHEVYLQPEMFEHAQDKVFMKNVMLASKDATMWIFRLAIPM